MSVISSPVRKPRRWLHLWPLALFLLLAVCGSLWLWQAWPQVMMKSVVWQRDVNQQMSGLLKAVAANPAQAVARAYDLVLNGTEVGGGSIRIPAAACGLFGLKAGRGRISMGPMTGEALNGAAVQGVVSHSVRDTAAMLDVLQGPEAHAPYHMPAPEVPYLRCLERPPGRLREIHAS